MSKNSSVITYAAGAGLAAIALVYVFGPTYLIDESPNGTRRSSHAVGLRNVGNDCFINSILQALAGLGELRLYLIRETHRRVIDADVYEALVRPTRSADAPSHFGGKELKEWQIRSLQAGAVTAGLKEMLDRLNERPISKKAISPRGFVAVLEGAFGQTINRQQQDAQEFLQLLVERLQDEYNAGKRARAHAKREQNRRKLAGIHISSENGTPTSQRTDPTLDAFQGEGEEAEYEEHDFPLEGEREAQSECMTCGYKTHPRKEVFCMLTLSVPQVRQVPSLHARKLLANDLSKLPPTPADASEDPRPIMREALRKLDESIEKDPENPPSDNMAKVSFPEQLRLGGLRETKRYKLLATVTHKGGHSSGHYQSFRRHAFAANPFSNPHLMSGVYSRAATPLPHPAPAASTPNLVASPNSSGELVTPPGVDESFPSAGPVNGASSKSGSIRDKDKDKSDSSSIRSVAASALSKLSPSKSGSNLNGQSSVNGAAPSERRPRTALKKKNQKWWRINDEKVREARTSEVLDMEREVYLLFYELEADEPSDV
ncbi:unnamed protein product [Parascedosporium putredinis]|uniref:Ubiquitin carboxyl-terminal hydrolase n=1 Tax=Parascedosporium putredinis TaxID=1442378 RepID=A0A9P1M882_9PEZI|nr:unnamed protein product [Parascedosporium putredinis]CAI7989395.1 unnamed protein product [Parascedosporium putredinis]